jgi:hypothetical protein
MTFLAAALFFGLFVATHVVCVRAGLFRFQLAYLILLAIFWLCIYLTALGAFPGYFQTDGGLFVFTPVVLYLLLFLCYVVEWTTIDYESSSMKIMGLVNRGPKEGTPYAALKEVFTDEKILLPRLMDLVSYGYVKCDGRDYCLLPKGVMISRLFEIYRKLLGRGLGG